MSRHNSLEPAALKQHFSAWLEKQERFAMLAPLLAGIKISCQERELIISFVHAYFADFYFRNARLEMEAALQKYLGNVAIHYHGASLACDRPQGDRPLFANFVCSSKNEPVLAAARHLCESASHACAILIIRGGSGCGKTHLLGEIGKALESLFSSSEIFKIQAPFFPAPISPDLFWRRRRALLLDDLQDMSRDNERQTSLAACLDLALSRPHFYRVAIALNGDLSNFGPKLCQRLEQSLLLDLYPADLAARIQYLEMENNRLGLGLQKNRIVLLARQLPKIPVIAGVLQKYKFYSKIGGQNLSPEELANIPLPDTTAITWQRILMLVADRLGLKPGEILSRNRRQELVLARHAAMFLCRTRLGLSYPELGRAFGGLDHSTVMHGIKKIQQLRLIDKDMHKLLTELEAELD